MGKTTKDHDLQKNRLLLPANLALKKTSPQSESPPSASRKTVTKSACLSCQKRKTKCSGERPACAKCISFNISCSYETDLADETHAQSRKRKYDELQAMNITYKEIYDFIQNSSRPQAEEVLKRIRSGIGAEPILSQIKGRNLSPHSPPCFQRLLSWRQCRPSLNQEMATDELDQSTILTLPPQPLDAYKTDANEDTWTQIGWTKAHIRHLIDAIFPWDYLPFSLLCYDLFMQSFYSDSAQFCSPALVCAILALASRVVNEDKDDLEILPSGWIGSRTFFKKATAALQEGLSDSLPDIQAVGILSLYHLRCGKEAEAQDCAESFHRRVVELCKHGFSLGDDDEQYLAVRDTTYCGAVSLSRILLLSTGQAFNLSSATLEMHTSIAEKLSILETGNKDVGHAYREYSDKEGGNNGKPRNNMAAFTTVGNQSHLHNLQFVSGLIFQLTEWVYDFITSAPSSTPNVSNTARVFYQKCLDWYEAFFTYAESDFGRTPFVLFTHMYYHFSLLCAFRPLTSVSIEDVDIEPPKICKEAAQSILALSQSYDDLFTLRRVSGLVPYFVCAAGLFGISMKAEGASMNPVHLRLADCPPGNRAGSTQQAHWIGSFELSATSSYITMSATDHARQLLTKMASTHQVAGIARDQLLNHVSQEEGLQLQLHISKQHVGTSNY